MSRAPSASSLALALLLASPAARATESDDKRVCLATYVQAQAMRQDGKLRASQEALVQCGRSVCPVVIRNDCVRWLGEVTDAMPTVVLSATGPDGRDRSDARVSADGQPLASRLDGRPVAVDPGEHVFRFELDDGAVVEERVLVREAEHDRPVTGVFPRTAPSTVSARAVTETSRPVPLGVWVLGGVAATSLLVSASFAGLGWFGSPGWVSSQSCKPGCAPGDVDTVRQRFAVADLAGAVGVVTAGAAAYFFFTRPERRAPVPASLGLAPRAVTVELSGEF